MKIWTPVELVDDGTGTFHGSAGLSGATRLTYVVQAVDNRGNVTWLDYVSTQLPASGVALGIPQPVDVLAVAPSNLTATATSPTSVVLTWNGGPSAVSYDVYRSASIGTYSKIGSSSGTTYTDHGAAAGVAYLYAVKAVDASSNSSHFSNHDIATTIIFVDPTLVAGGTTIKAVHLTQLRAAVNAVRVLAGLGSYSFTDANILSGSTSVKALHVLEARTALDEARALLGLPPAEYAGSAVGIGARIERLHIHDIRKVVQ